MIGLLRDHAVDSAVRTEGGCPIGVVRIYPVRYRGRWKPTEAIEAPAQCDGLDQLSMPTAQPVERFKR